MVFPSVPVYLDPPNWNQLQATHHHHGGGGGGGGGGGVGAGGGGGGHSGDVANESSHLPLGSLASNSNTNSSSIRPASMSERARLAKIPQPEQALNCPRCDSTNTKFCYFNNYSLSQPRHFCKTCRRYWTRGGALRNVPVGGGCRRNKRTKSSATGSSSKTTTTSVAAPTTDRQSGTSSSTASTAASVGIGSGISSNISSISHLPFVTSLHPLENFSVQNLGLGFSGIHPVDPADYQVGTTVGLEQWRVQQIQQFPFLSGLEPPPPPPPPPPALTGMYHLDLEGCRIDGSAFGGQMPTAKTLSSEIISHLASVKMEDNSQTLSLPRLYMDIPRNINDSIWGGSTGGSVVGGNGGGWIPDLSGFNSSSTGNLL